MRSAKADAFIAPGYLAAGYPNGMASATRSLLHARSPLVPTSIEIGGLSALIAAYWMSDELLGEGGDELVNVLGPLAFIAIMGFGAVQMLRIDVRSIFLPLFTFRVASAVYFGLGSLVHLIVSPERRAMIESLYFFNDSEVAKLNLIIACSTLTILLVCGAAESVLNFRSATAASSMASASAASARRLRNYGVVFFSLGSTLKYLFVFPVSIGWVAWGEVPGSVIAIAEMSLIGLNLLTIWSLSSAPAFFPLVCLLVGMEMFTGLVLFTKAQVLLPLLMLLVGVMAQRLTWQRMLTAVVVVAFSMEIMQPLVGYARDEFNARTGGATANATIGLRLEILASYFDPYRTRRPYEEPGEGLMRISYVNAGTFAIASYDRGHAGDSFKNIFISLVPRVLWPDKPLLQEGGEFALVASGRYAENSVSPGMFAEAYWNFGWMGIPLVMTSLGLFLLLMSRYALWVLRREKWLFFPIALIGLKVGLGIDGMFVGQIVGTGAIVIVLHFATAACAAVLRRLGIDAADDVVS